LLISLFADNTSISILKIMARVLSIDYGAKRTGLAVTDPLRIIANALTTVETPTLMAFLKNYVQAEEVERILVGLPLNLDDSETHNTAPARKFVEKLRKEFPRIVVEEVDERYTSKMAKTAMLEMGMKKMQRRDKAMVDKIAATIMLQEWLEKNG
jgi:putative Holliday junction resolvase